MLVNCAVHNDWLLATDRTPAFSQSPLASDVRWLSMDVVAEKSDKLPVMNVRPRRDGWWWVVRCCCCCGCPITDDSIPLCRYWVNCRLQAHNVDNVHGLRVVNRWRDYVKPSTRPDREGQTTASIGRPVKRDRTCELIQQQDRQTTSNGGTWKTIWWYNAMHSILLYDFMCRREINARQTNLTEK